MSVVKKLTASIISLLVVLSCIFCFGTTNFAYAENNVTEIENTINDTINYERSIFKANSGESIFNAYFFRDNPMWVAIGLGRSNYEDNFAEYYNYLVATKIKDAYTKGIDKITITELYKYALAYTATSKKAPINMLKNSDGNPVNLIADSTYNNEQLKGLVNDSRCMITWWTYGLITLDSMSYIVPEDAKLTREDFVTHLLRCQLADGGFSLIGGSVSDIDVTAMALQALAPYYTSQKVYNYTAFYINDTNGIKKQCQKKVGEVIDEALQLLSTRQNDKGGYTSSNTVNSESVSQVITALSSLGIDIFTDSRFIKDGNNLFDALLKFKVSTGGFIHSYDIDNENTQAVPGKVNGLATEQALYALVALYRNQTGMRNLYDMKSEFTTAEKQQILQAVSSINSLSSSSTKQQVEDSIKTYLQVEDTNRVYVKNYNLLVNKAVQHELTNLLPDEVYAKEGLEQPEKIIFTDKDKQKVNNLPEKIDTSYAEIINVLKYKIDECENFEDYDIYKNKVDEYFNMLVELNNKIAKLKNDIAKYASNPKDLKLSDKQTIDKIYKEFYSLSNYDIENNFAKQDIESLNKAKAQLRTMQQNQSITLACVGLIVLILMLLFGKFMNNRHKRKKLMKESDE